LPNHGFLLLTTYPSRVEVDTVSFIPPKEPYELNVHEFGDTCNNAIGKQLIKIDNNTISTDINLVGRSIALSYGPIMTYGIIAYRE